MGYFESLESHIGPEIRKNVDNPWIDNANDAVLV